MDRYPSSWSGSFNGGGAGGVTEAEVGVIVDDKTKDFITESEAEILCDDKTKDFATKDEVNLKADKNKVVNLVTPTHDHAITRYHGIKGAIQDSLSYVADNGWIGVRNASPESPIHIRQSNASLILEDVLHNGLKCEVRGQLLDYGVNYKQLGGDYKDKDGAFFRIDVRPNYKDSELFSIYTQPRNTNGNQEQVFKVGWTGNTEMMGNITIRGGNPTSGAVLTATNNDGLAEWKTPTSIAEAKSEVWLTPRLFQRINTIEYCLVWSGDSTTCMTSTDAYARQNPSDTVTGDLAIVRGRDNQSIERSKVGVGGSSIYLRKDSDYFMQQSINLNKKSFAISFWMSDNLVSEYILGTSKIAMANKSLHIGWRDQNTFTIAFWSNDVNITVPSPYDNTFAYNKWGHICIVHDTDTLKSTLYMNGKKLGSGVHSSKFLGVFDKINSIAGRTGSSFSLSNLRVMTHSRDTILNDTEVKFIYDEEKKVLIGKQ